MSYTWFSLYYPGRSRLYTKDYNELKHWNGWSRHGDLRNELGFRAGAGNPYNRLEPHQVIPVANYYGLTHSSDLEEEYASNRSKEFKLMAKMVNTCYLLEHPYLELKCPELRKMARVRGIDLEDVRGRPQIVDLLEKDDKEKTRFRRFPELPKELRCMIYKYAFLQKHLFRRNTALYLEPHSGRCLDAEPGNGSAYGTGEGPLYEHHITRTCTEVRLESLPLFYQYRRFPLEKVRYIKGTIEGTRNGTKKISVLLSLSLMSPWDSPYETRLRLKLLHIDFVKGPAYVISKKENMLSKNSNGQVFGDELRKQLDVMFAKGLGNFDKGDFAELLRFIKEFN